MKILLANNVDPGQTPHHVASDLSLHCLPMTLDRFPGKDGLTTVLLTVTGIAFNQILCQQTLCTVLDQLTEHL